MARGIFPEQGGIKPMIPALAVQSFNHLFAREVHIHLSLVSFTLLNPREYFFFREEGFQFNVPSTSPWASLVTQMVQNLPAHAGNSSLIPGLGRSPGEGNGNPLQYFCLEVPCTEESGSLQSMESQKRQTQFND